MNDAPKSAICEVIVAGLGLLIFLEVFYASDSWSADRSASISIIGEGFWPPLIRNNPNTHMLPPWERQTTDLVVLVRAPDVAERHGGDVRDGRAPELERQDARVVRRPADAGREVGVAVRAVVGALVVGVLAVQVGGSARGQDHAAVGKDPRLGGDVVAVAVLEGLVRRGVFLHEAAGGAAVGEDGGAVGQVGGADDVAELDVRVGGHELLDELLGGAVLEADDVVGGGHGEGRRRRCVSLRRGQPGRDRAQRGESGGVGGRKPS